MQLDQHEIEVVTNYIGSTVNNLKGETMGFVAGVFSTRKNKNAEYIILGTDFLFGNSTRFFAIPASSQMIVISKKSMSVKIDRDQLMQAKRIQFAKCPNPLFDLDPLIYELTDIHNNNFQNLKRAES